MSTIKTLWIAIVTILSLVPIALTAGGIAGVLAGVYFVSTKLILGGVASYLAAVVVEATYEGFVYDAVESVNKKLAL